MRILLATAMLLCGLAVVPSPADARALACTDLVTAGCDGFLCYDENLDGRLTWDECVFQVCPSWGCCTCPPPEWW
ncbi:MAG TPA: hypothetical protein VNX21_06105 [Candidatus Thermoplasmatota archaeon]|nr:hypothetical protein [Candidatus Thermoplasmatota archaeon]